MEKLDIKVKKSAKGGYLDGSFYVKELDFDECLELHEKTDENSDSNSRLVQLCLVRSSGERVFKPQQVNLIKKRIGGVDFMCILAAANELNDFEKIGRLAEKYSKNSESDQN